MNYSKPYLSDANNFGKNNAFNYDYQPKTAKNSLSKNFAFPSTYATKVIK